MGRRDEPPRRLPTDSASPEAMHSTSSTPPPPPVPSLYPYIGFYQHLFNAAGPPAFFPPSHGPPPFQLNPLLLNNLAMNPFLLQAAYAAGGGGGPMAGFMDRLKLNRFSPYSSPPPPSHLHADMTQSVSPPLSSPHPPPTSMETKAYPSVPVTSPSSSSAVPMSEVTRSAFQCVVPRQQQQLASGVPPVAADSGTNIPNATEIVSPSRNSSDRSSPCSSQNSAASPSSSSSSLSASLLRPPAATASEIKSIEEMVNGLNGSRETTYGIAHESGRRTVSLAAQLRWTT